MVEVISRPTFQEMVARGRDATHIWAQDFLGFESHVGQIAWFLRANVTDDGHGYEIRKHEAKEGCLACSNRWGKTVAAAIKHLHRSFYQIRPDRFRLDHHGNIRDYRVCNIAMTLDQALLGFDIAAQLATNSPRFSRFVLDQVGTPFPKLTIGVQKRDVKWKSEIWARSTAKGARFLLGHNFNFINWDEAAWDSEIGKVLDTVIRMRLLDQSGDLDLISSPNGYNEFQQIWDLGQSNDPYYYSLTGHIFQNVNPRTGIPNVAVEDLKRKASKMHPDWVRQNIYGLFAKMDNVFPVSAVQRCYADQDYRFATGYEDMPGMYLAPNFVLHSRQYDHGAELLIPDRSHKPRRYVIGADLGRKLDYTAIVVLMLPEEGEPPFMRLVYFELLNKVKWEQQWRRIQRLSRAYNNAPLMIDSTALGGDMALETLQDQYGLKVEGFNFSKPKKEALLMQLQETIQSATVVFPYIPDLVTQLTYYRYDDKRLQTDAVMGLALAVEMARLHMGGTEWDLLSAPDLPLLTRSRDLLSGESQSPGLDAFLADLADEPLDRYVII